jgi:hypothetical protein
MPVGVEHSDPAANLVTDATVMTASMPAGVEHILDEIAGGNGTASDDRSDAGIGRCPLPPNPHSFVRKVVLPEILPEIPNKRPRCRKDERS